LLLADRSFVELSVAGFHPEGEFGVESGQFVVALRETSRDRTRIRQPRSSMVRRQKIGIELLLMTCAAGKVSDEATMGLLRRVQGSGGRALWTGIRRRTPRQSDNADPNRDYETRGKNESFSARGSYPPAGVGYGNSGMENIWNLLSGLPSG
jgi:hypothetical protein